MADHATPPLRLGIIGANPERGWASRAHLPAVAALAEVELVAVATSNARSAEAAARRFGAALAFSGADALIGHPDVEAVTVAIKVPQHHELVRAALELREVVDAAVGDVLAITADGAAVGGLGQLRQSALVAAQ